MAGVYDAVQLATGPFNQVRNKLERDASGHITENIIAATSSPVGPDTIIRRKAWGAASDVAPNFRDAADSNSEIISINNRVRGVLNPLDKRSKYVLIGATWMKAFGTGNPLGTQGAQFNTDQVGTSRLNNATMETFVDKQGLDNTSTATDNCFSCHLGTQITPKGINTENLSHVFNTSKPLPTPTPTPTPTPP